MKKIQDLIKMFFKRNIDELCSPFKIPESYHVKNFMIYLEDPNSNKKEQINSFIEMFTNARVYSKTSIIDCFYERRYTNEFELILTGFDVRNLEDFLQLLKDGYVTIRNVSDANDIRSLIDIFGIDPLTFKVE